MATFTLGIVKTNAVTALTVTVHGQLSIQEVPSGTTLGSNWLRWSAVGRLDFTIGRGNVAGQMPLPTNGTIYQILERAGRLIVYGKDDIFSLQPSGAAYGFSKLLSLGLKSKLAVISTDEAHYFIDSLNRLWRFGEGLQLLDYREWLSGLGSVVLSFDPNTRHIYICDGVLGYVYNPDTKSFGKGPATITSIAQRSGTLYVGASATPTVPTFQIVTDTQDFNTRGGKSIHALEVGVDTPLSLEASIDYRYNKQDPFTSTGWYAIDSRGRATIPVYGHEFRFKVRATSAGWFHLDSLAVYGVIHAS